MVMFKMKTINDLEPLPVSFNENGYWINPIPEGLQNCTIWYPETNVWNYLIRMDMIYVLGTIIC